MEHRGLHKSGLLDRIAYANPKETLDPRDILSSLGEVVYDWDLLSDRLRWGPNVREVLGLGEAQTLETGAAYSDCIAPASGTARHEAIIQSSETDRGCGVRYHTHYGLFPSRSVEDRTWVEDAGRWFAGPAGRPAHAHGVIRVIAHGALATPAVHHDPLTGALSRARFGELSARMFDEAVRTRTQCSLMLVAIDGLAVINQLYGFGVADQLIAAVARRLTGRLRPSDLIARYAGNKFAIALTKCDSDQLAAAAKRCLECVTQEPVCTDVGPLRASVRIGAVVAPRYASTHCSLFLHAEEALDVSRFPGAPRFNAFAQGLAQEGSRQETRRVSEQIIAALNDRRIYVVLEPIVEASSGRTMFYEALMRMRLMDSSVLSPTTVFSVAEKAGLAPLLDQRVLELALARLAADPSLTLSVNVSGLTAREPDWPEKVQAAASLHPGCAERLIIEITETCAIEDIESTRRAIARLRSFGVRVAMDDFGAGHTSFRNLRGLQLDLLKIDGAFVQNLARSPDDRFFVRTLLELAQHVGIPAVAEWVEDEETARLLKEWGVTYFQGALFGRAGDTDLHADRGRAEAAA